MSTVKPIPEGVHTVTPHLVCAGAADAMQRQQQQWPRSSQSRGHTRPSVVSLK